MKRQENWKSDGDRFIRTITRQKYVQFEHYEKYLHFVSLALLAMLVLRGLIGCFSSKGVCAIATDNCFQRFSLFKDSFFGCIIVVM